MTPSRRSLLKALAVLPFWGLAAREVVEEPSPAPVTRPPEMYRIQCVGGPRDGLVLQTEHLAPRLTFPRVQAMQAADIGPQGSLGLFVEPTFVEDEYHLCAVHTDAQLRQRFEYRYDISAHDGFSFARAMRAIQTGDWSGAPHEKALNDTFGALARAREEGA